MTKAALIILDDDRPVGPVLGLCWPEFQLRRAVTAGALHLVLVAGHVTRDVVQAVDRLRRDGMSTTLARTTADVADLFHPDEAVLLMTGASVVADASLAALLAARRPAVLTLDAQRAGSAHELIDAHDHWVGLARIDGAHVRATAATPGDWDLGSMLLRQVVASRADRLSMAADDTLFDAAAPRGAAQVARALIAASASLAPGWGERWIVMRLARLLILNLASLSPVLARFGSIAAIMAFVVAPAAQLAHWTAAGLVLFLAGAVLAEAARLARAVTGMPALGARPVAAARDVAGIALLALIVWQSPAHWTFGVLAVGVVAFVALADRIISVETTTGVPEGPPGWLADRAGLAVILFVASLFGQSGAFAGLLLGAAHGLVTLAYLQNRLSRVLTSLR